MRDGRRTHDRGGGAFFSRCLLLAAAVAAVLGISAAQAQDEEPKLASRPVPTGNRWQEDWSVLADPALRTQPGDRLKYLPFGTSGSYLSLGATLRERMETNDAPSFGLRGDADTYLLQRLQLHADARFGRHWQAFAQIEDVRTVGKRVIGGADRNPWDLRLAFLAYARAFDAGTFKARVGRQDFAFDLQRFVSLRDGPNVRQSFDAIWADWETGRWRFIGFLSRPVQYADEHPFDDVSNRHLRFDTLRVERKLWGSDELSAYYSRYSRDDAAYPDATGHESRDVYDLRFAGAARGVDWDVEAMRQLGTVGAKRIDAWAWGARLGYTAERVTWSPRIGLQFDVASGDRRRGDRTLGTFNPLFPNGSYFTLAGYTGYANLVHVKPSLTLQPVAGLSVTGAIGLLWRKTARDAIYVQPSLPLPGTAGLGGRWTAAYAQLRVDRRFSANLSGALEAVRYDVGRAIRSAGGRDADYLGVELKLLW